MTGRSRTVVIGAGLAGLASAHALLADGHDVLVIEANSAPGLGTSFANGGLLTPSMPEPWNGPGVWRHLLSSLFVRGSPMILRPAAIPGLLGWGTRFLKKSSRSHFEAATLDNYRLARYSVELTLAVCERHRFDIDLSRAGTLCIFRTATDMAERAAISRLLADHGLAMRIVDADEAVNIEPALAPVRDTLAGAVYLPDDARGDAQAFCGALASVVTGAGGELRYDTRAVSVLAEGGAVSGVATDAGFVPARQVVVAAASASPALLAVAGVRLQVRPAKGYSITVNVDGLAGLPKVAVQDDATHAVLSVLGSRLRIVGIAEFSGFDATLPPQRIAHLESVLDSCLPAIAPKLDRRRLNPWSGFRPMSADGRPYIGPCGWRGLFVNSGHGALGWTQAMGSARLLADRIAGREPAIDDKPFDAMRG